MMVGGVVADEITLQKSQIGRNEDTQLDKVQIMNHWMENVPILEE